MFIFIDIILSHALWIPVHVTCKQGWAGQQSDLQSDLHSPRSMSLA